MKIIIASHFGRNEKIREFLINKSSKFDVINIRSNSELSNENLTSLSQIGFFFHIGDLKSLKAYFKNINV